MKASEISFENVLERAQVLKSALPKLTVEITGSWVWVSGDTKPYKEDLKDHGLRFSRTKVKWYLKGAPCSRYGRRGADWSYIANKYGVEELAA
jgi:hypothetical protein